MRTPAQASGHPDFVTDVPVQGPTDTDMRAGSCWFAQNVVPTHPSCVDCGEGPIPMNRTFVSPRQYPGMVGERLSYRGSGAIGFAFGAAGDPEVWTKLSADQQKWIVESLTMLNNLVYQATGTTCPTWGPSITAAGGCFQGWFNANMKGMTKADGSALVLRTDGVFDQDTLDALRTVAALDPGHFTTPFPGTKLPGLEKQKEGLSTGAIVGIAAGGALVVGGTIWALTKKKR